MAERAKQSRQAASSVNGAANAPANSYFFEHYRRRSLGPLAATLMISAVVFLFVSAAAYALWWQAPASFPAGSVFSLRSGATLAGAADELVKRGLARSQFWFKTFSVLLGGQRGLKAGYYYFAAPVSISRLAWRLTRGRFDILPARVTVPEGSSNRQIAVILKRSLPDFNEALFLNGARGKEGYLFPDTYLFLPGQKEQDIITAMTDNFERRFKGVEREFEMSGRTREQVIIIASLVEEEGRTTETRRTIAGILWKRLDRGMPLQVDAVFHYIFGDRPYDLSDGDLQVDSPYNTYTHAGLPPGPITNPGLAAISAALTPLKTAYLYYLTDKEGRMHYARALDEHLANRARYLRI